MEADGEFAGYKDFQKRSVKGVIKIRLRAEIDCCEKRVISNIKNT